MVDFAAPHCADCLRPPAAWSKPKPIRGLCPACYERHRAAGTRGLFPRRLRERAELLAEVDHLLGFGWSLDEVAGRLGVRRGSVVRARQRAAAAARAGVAA